MKDSGSSRLGVSCILGILLCAVVLAPAGRLEASSGVTSGPGAAIKQTTGAEQQPYWSEDGRLTLGFQFGYALENNIPHDISHINMMIVEPQIGIVAWDSPHSRLPVKRFEIISEGILGSAYRPGGSLLGDTLLLRLGLNPAGRLVPFIDAGSGPLHTTANRHASEISGGIQFLSQGGAGIQYFYRPERALVLEYRYFHMSNAGLQEPNPGFNGSMLTVGFCWLRRPHSPVVATAHHSFFAFLHLR